MIDTLSAASGRDVPRETIEKLELYHALVVAEANRQNLVARSTLDGFWHRHIIDSAQLMRFTAPSAHWADIGSGAGLPGIVLACFPGQTVTLIEPRRLRADFLERVVERLALSAEVHHGKAESATGVHDMITARAVARLARLIDISLHLSTGNSLFVFPKGKSAQSELAEAKRTWQASFHVKQSLTDPQSHIILARNVRRRR